MAGFKLELAEKSAMNIAHYSLKMEKAMNTIVSNVWSVKAKVFKTTEEFDKWEFDITCDIPRNASDEDKKAIQEIITEAAEKVRQRIV